MIKVGIFGATGYTGQELCRILSRHRDVEIVALASQSQAGQSVTLPVRNSVKLSTGRPFNLMSIEAALDVSMDVAFLCLSHGEGMQVASRLIDAQIRVIDLSADFRLSDPLDYEKVYGVRQTAASYLPLFKYGLPELFRDQIRTARAVANPGCYPTTVALAVSPFIKRGLISSAVPVIVDSKSGVSGAGRKPSDNTHFVTVHDNFRPYNVCRAHRHVPEMEQTLNKYESGFKNQIIFTPSLLPVSRGMLSSVYIPLAERFSRAECLEFFVEHYAEEPFVSVLTDVNSTPDLAAVKGTNNALISVHVHGQTALILVAIDNLGKGASGQAVQNMNLMFDIEESCGLTHTTTYY